jgi:hypothetical protein
MNKAMEEGHGDGTHHQAESGSHWMGDKLIHVVKYDTEIKE